MKASSFQFPLIVAAGLLLSAIPSQGAAAFWSFQTSPNTGTSNTTALTSQSGFATAPSVSFITGTGGAAFASGTGGANYTDPNTGTPWIGDNITDPNIGATYGINASTTLVGGVVRNLTGAGFSVSLDTTGLTDLKVRFDLRTATSNSSARGKVGAVTSFSAINYRTSTGAAWETVGISDFSAWNWAVDGSWTNNQAEVDLSQFAFLNGNATLELQFIFNGAEKVPTTEGGSTYVTQNIRIDNLLVTAVPEPSAIALVSAAALGLGLRRRR